MDLLLGVMEDPPGSRVPWSAGLLAAQSQHDAREFPRAGSEWAPGQHDARESLRADPVPLAVLVR